MGYENILHDRSISRNVKTFFRPVQDFKMGLRHDPATGRIHSAYSGVGMFLTPISTSGLMGLSIEKAGDCIYDVDVFFPFIDKNRAFDLSVIALSSSTDADALIFTLKYYAITDSAAIPSASSGITMETITLTGTANVPIMSAWKSVTAQTFTKNSGYYFGIEMTDIGAASPGEVKLLGLQARGYLGLTGED